MFNYDDLKATLVVAHEVSPSLLDNYYTKEESDEKFVTDVPNDETGDVYGRSYKEWVKLQNESSDQ